ncbi:MAG: site-specific DNA-methyltransferase [Terrimicrobiaceae bacterium]|nr:site-specific DNA-methyltransferase [Terrimicrobiaceae bacterium]
MRTELVWDGKYDEFGNRREVDVAACAMPMQKIETVDEPRQRAAAEGQIELFDQGVSGRVKEESARYGGEPFRNRLIWGDNKLVLASLLAEFKGRVDLIYIDPPFDVGADFTMDVPIGDWKETVGKDQSTLEMVAYRDMWGKGTDSYLHMMFERLTLMKELLSDKGSIYVHCDWHMSAQLRILLNEVFGTENFLNEIVWYYYNKLHDSRKKILPRAHDVILRYAKVPGSHVHNAPKEKRDEPVKKLKYRKVDGQIQNIIGPDGKAVTYISEDRTVDDVWRIRCLQPANIEETLGYNTQKPEDFVERILRMGSDEGDLVADFFCGSGTTGAVAERLGRRWLMADLGRFSIHTSRKRLIDLQRKLHDEGKPYRAFDVYNLGRYERQWWQKDRLKGADAEHRRVVLEFFKAEVLSSPPNPLLHGRKAGAFCHVDGIDGLFTRNEARAVAEAAVQAGGREVYCLAWEFEMELRTHCLALEAEFKIKMKLVPIPREIMEKNRTSPPPFLEMAVLEAEAVVRKSTSREAAKSAKSVDVKLTKFLPSLAEVPSKELEALKERAVKSGFDFIDFWAVDFDWHPGKPFNHHWQDYRTRKDRSLKTVSDAGHTYEKGGKHTICVKVVDVFGCDTSITIDVTV